MGKINNMLADLDSYSNIKLKDAISDRLNKNLENYLHDLKISYISLITNTNNNKLIKELSKG